MPYKCEKTALGDAFFKRSAKLLPCQKEMVVYWSNKGLSQRKIAAIFKVSRRLITFIVSPDKLRANLEQRNASGGSKQYYDRETHNEAIKSTRKYKHKLITLKDFTAE